MLHQKKSLLICKQCPSAVLSKGLFDEDIVLCGCAIQKCPYQIGYADNNSYLLKLCGRKDLTIDDFV